MATTQNLDGLLSFLRNPSNKCFWDEENVAVKESPLGGSGVFANKDLSAELEDDSLILRISKESILSSETSCIANLLHDSGISGIQAMILSFIYEKSIGESSPWYDYINSINIYNDNGDLILPPSLWSDEEKALLKGTEAEVLGAIDPSEPQEFFAFSIQFAKDHSNIFPIPVELNVSTKDTKQENMKKFNVFVAYCGSIASRAFAIDDYHQVALVPGADLFNHNSYGEENVHFETVSNVCPYCGAADGCGHNDFGPPDSEEEEEEENSDHENGSDDWEEMDVDDEADSGDEDEDEEPEEDLKEITVDYITKMEEELEAERLAEEEADQEEDDVDEDEDEELREQSGEEDEDVESDAESLILIPDDCVDIVLRKDIKAGEEIFNTYGDLSNSVLISRYGFTSPFNPNDYIGLGRQALKLAKKKEFKEHFQFWDEQGFDMFQDYLKIKKRESHEHDHDHDHELGHDHNHDKEGCCDDEYGGCCGDEEEDEEDDEESWELELRIRFDGEPSESTYLLASLLTLTKKELTRLKKHSEPELLLEALSELTKPKKKAYQIILEWCVERAKLYNDGGLTSTDYDLVISKLEEGHHKSISILIQSEKAILERGLISLEAHI